MTEHADSEASADGFSIFDMECAMLTGKIRRMWPRTGKYEIVGSSSDGRALGIVCRITDTGKVRVITVYEDKPKKTR
ncbi:DUF4258 domain-containing protein [Candidatus Acetothermia bacterium]|nr:DUF4258 domain-containing protein [Candidatus Acetothermia bacterium]MBI3461079.1 DUF4258 domain-containing protein [Candidatus Acetothermia bacterium]MBI3659584.1 DUF4258 domain-containing protein [Candidatus Acetothermia bacterium]